MKSKIIYIFIFLFSITSCIKEEKNLKENNETKKYIVDKNIDKNDSNKLENKIISKENKEKKIKIEEYDEYVLENIVEKNVEGKVIYYSKILDKDLEINDILRNYYKRIIHQIDKTVNFEGVNINKFKITKKELILGENNEIILPFEKFKRVFKANTGLPSLYNGPFYKIEKKELDMSKKHIAFTFDDGPLNENHDKIRKLFDDISQSATFCVVGSAFPKNKERLINTYLNGHEIINHTTTHANLTKLSENKIFENVIKTSDLVLEYTGYDIEYVRPPYGAFNKKVRKVLDNKLALWTLDSQDWKSRNKDIIVDKVLNNIKDLDIVLFHDLYDETYEAVKYMIPILLENGYEFTTYSEVMRLRLEKNNKI